MNAPKVSSPTQLKKLDIRAQSGEVFFTHVARHASGGQADVAGIGITQMDGRKGTRR